MLEPVACSSASSAARRFDAGVIGSSGGATEASVMREERWPSILSLMWSQFRLQQRQFWRNRQSAVFSFALPVLFVILFGLLFRNTGTSGTGPYTFQITAGALPPGLFLSTSGVLSGTVTGAGTFRLAVTRP